MMPAPSPILLAYDAAPADMLELQAGLPDVTVFPVATPLQSVGTAPAEALQTELLSIGLASHIEWATLQQFPRVRLLAVRSDGVSQVDLDACTDAGVTVCNTPHFGDPTVAEHTFALLLALSRRLLLPYQPTATEDANAWQGWDLAGKTLGVIGLGHVGRRVARFGHAFGMRVLAHDIAPDPQAAEGLGLRLRHGEDLRHWSRPLDQAELEETVEVVSFDDLLRRADVVTLHTPYARQTQRLMDAAAIASMKRGAVLLNTARGGLVDLGAVRDALDRGWLGGVGLDVVESDDALLLEEAGPEAPPTQRRQALLAAAADLLPRPNVVISPHNAYNSAEARQRIIATTIATVRAFLDGHPINVVQPMSWG